MLVLEIQITLKSFSHKEVKATMRELFLEIQGLEESSPEVKADMRRYRQGLEPLTCSFLYQYFL
jgi:hypothetical protein